MDFVLKLTERHIPFTERASIDTYIVLSLIALGIILAILFAYMIGRKLGELKYIIFSCSMLLLICGMWIYALSSIGLSRTLPPENKGYYITKQAYKISSIQTTNVGFKNKPVIKDHIILSDGDVKWELNTKKHSGLKVGDKVKLQSQVFWVGKKAPQQLTVNEGESLFDVQIMQGLRYDTLKFKALKDKK